MADSGTKISRDEVLDLCQAIRATCPDLPSWGSRSLGLYRCVRLVLVFLRHNLTHALLAQMAGVSQPTVSRVIAVYTPLIAQALQDTVPTVEDLDPTGQLIIDGTLLKCWDWKDTPGLFSGEHHAPGMNIQVACTLSGHLAWVSDPMPGASHDAAALRASGLLEVPTQDLPPGADPPSHICDKGYTGLNMIVPKKRPPGQDLHPDDKTYNTTINQIRYQIEKVIANTQDMAHPAHRLQTTTRNLPHNPHSNPRNHIHLHPMNKPPGRTVESCGSCTR